MPDYYDFKEFIDKYPTNDTPDVLPIVHTTSLGAFNKILIKKKLVPKLCKVYNEHLIYFFYGRACYLVNKEGLTKLTDDEPVTVVFDIKAIEAYIHRVLPFDSGGFENYDIRKHFDLEDFTYNLPDADVLNKMTGIFYESNGRYRDKQFSASIDQVMADMCRPVTELIRLANSIQHSNDLQTGEQGTVFEIQYKDQEIPFNPLIILTPFSYFSDDNWDNMKAKYLEDGVILDYYNDNNSRRDGAESHTNMRQKVLKLLKKYYD